MSGKSFREKIYKGSKFGKLQEYEKYERHLKNKEKSAIKKAEEMKMKRKESLLKVLEGESIDNIDINSDEGMTVIEGMVGEKLAERLVGELGAILGSSGKSKSKWITPSTGGGKFNFISSNLTNYSR